MVILGLPEAIASQPAKPAHFNLEKVIRSNILALHPYRCARDDYQSGILLDANENALGHSISRHDPDLGLGSSTDSDLDLDLHRYPDPAQREIKSRIAALRGLPGPEHVFLGVGSDEVIDLLMRVCCRPEHDRILVTPPTYGMYAVTAQVNDIGIVKIPLDCEQGKFQPRIEEVNYFISLLHVLISYIRFSELGFFLCSTNMPFPHFQRHFLAFAHNPILPDQKKPSRPTLQSNSSSSVPQEIPPALSFLSRLSAPSSRNPASKESL